MNTTKDETQKTTGWGVGVIIPIIVALIGACATIIAAFREPITERFFQTPTPAPAAAAFEIAGVWEGTDARGIVFRFTFAAKCEVGDACGKVELPGVSCTAIPVLVSTDGTTYEFDETSHQNCGPDTGNDFIKVLEDGTLLFGGSGQTPNVILYRK